MLRIGSGHRWRKELFVQGIRHGYLLVDDVEETLPPGLLTASEKWLLYFSLRASGIQLHDELGNVVTPDEIVPEHRELLRRNGTPRYPMNPYTESSGQEGIDVDHLA